MLPELAKTSGGQSSYHDNSDRSADEVGASYLLKLTVKRNTIYVKLTIRVCTSRLNDIPALALLLRAC